MRPGLYLHIPFCLRRCDYCDFNTYAGLDELMPAYADALATDLARVAAAGPAAVAPPGTVVDEGGWPELGSVFVGGGTPTYLPAGLLAAVLRRAREVLPIAADAEVTTEANPETITPALVEDLVAAGVNRISMGAQSFRPHVLAALGRWHDPERPLEAVEVVRAGGIERINLDLIYGTPGETDEDWEASLATALATGIEHVSAYALTVEQGTMYAHRIARGLAAAPDEDVQAERMATAHRRLTAAGLRRYEVSNWARPGAESRHNLLYWRGGDYLGVGAGAHGHWQGRRWWSVRPPGRYVELVAEGRTTTAGEEVVTADERREERLMMGLRTTEGVRRDEVEPLDEGMVDRLVGRGLLRADPDRLVLTDDGFALASSVVLALVG